MPIRLSRLMLALDIYARNQIAGVVVQNDDDDQGENDQRRAAQQPRQRPLGQQKRNFSVAWHPSVRVGEKLQTDSLVAYRIGTGNRKAPLDGSRRTLTHEP